MDTIYTKIWNALRLAKKANTGVTFNAHEALELLGVLECYEESRALLQSDYEKMIVDLRDKIKRLQDENFLLMMSVNNARNRGR